MTVDTAAAGFAACEDCRRKQLGRAGTHAPSPPSLADDSPVCPPPLQPLTQAAKLSRLAASGSGSASPRPPLPPAPAAQPAAAPRSGSSTPADATPAGPAALPLVAGSGTGPVGVGIAAPVVQQVQQQQQQVQQQQQQQQQPADGALAAAAAAAVADADTSDSASMLSALRLLADAGKGGALLQVRAALALVLRLAAARCPRVLLCPSPACLGTTPCRPAASPTLPPPSLLPSLLLLPCVFQEVVANWSSYSELAQQDMFSALQLPVAGGDWEQLEGRLQVALDLASLF